MQQALQSAIATEERHSQVMAEERAKVAADVAQGMEAAFQARLASLIQSHQQEMAASQLARDQQLTQKDSQHRSEVKAMEEAHQMKLNTKLEALKMVQGELDSLKGAYNKKCTAIDMKQSALQAAEDELARVRLQVAEEKARLVESVKEGYAQGCAALQAGHQKELDEVKAQLAEGLDLMESALAAARGRLRGSFGEGH